MISGSTPLPDLALQGWLLDSKAFRDAFQQKVAPRAFIVDSKKLEHGCRMIHAGFPSFCGLGLEDGHVPTFWNLL